MFDLDTETYRLGQVKLDTTRHLDVEFGVNGVEISVELQEDKKGENLDYVVGIEEVEKHNKGSVRHYLKIQRKLREAGQTAVEFYESHDNLHNGVKVVSIVAGTITVGSLVVLSLKNRRS